MPTCVICHSPIPQDEYAGEAVNLAALEQDTITALAGVSPEEIEENGLPTADDVFEDTVVVLPEALVRDFYETGDAGDAHGPCVGRWGWRSLRAS